MVKHIRMASLSEQMEQLQKQKETLALKMKQEEALKMKESYTIERLEVLNTGACNRRQQLGRKRKRTLYDSCEITALWHSTSRFEVILQILKRQSARIRVLETKIEEMENKG